MPEPPLRHEVADTAEHWPVRRRSLVGSGKIFDYLSDEVVTPAGDTMRRDWIDHTGAVGIIPLDEDDNVVVVHQYRHPVGLRMIEPPAGLLDVDGEDPLLAARRELAEEAGLAAADWRVLVDVTTTPGGVSESIRVYLARGLSPASRPDGFRAEGEEAHMDVLRVPLAELVEGILAGRLQSPTLVSGCLALWASRDRLDTLRTPEAPWRARDELAVLRAAAEVERPQEG